MKTIHVHLNALKFWLNNPKKTYSHCPTGKNYQRYLKEKSRPSLISMFAPSICFQRSIQIKLLKYQEKKPFIYTVFVVISRHPNKK